MSEPIVGFRSFQLLSVQRLLLERGKPVAISSRALDILIALVECAGAMVSKEQLIARVWPDTVVEEANLRVHIAALRRRWATAVWPPLHFEHSKPRLLFCGGDRSPGGIDRAAGDARPRARSAPLPPGAAYSAHRPGGSCARTRGAVAAATACYHRWDGRDRQDNCRGLPWPTFWPRLTGMAWLLSISRVRRASL